MPPAANPANTWREERNCLISLSIEPANETDWAGARYGEVEGLTLKEIRQLFAKCEADPSMRSINAILRLTREQRKARGEFSHMWHIIGVLAFFVPSMLLMAIVTKEPSVKTEMLAGGAFFGLGLFAASVMHWRVRHQRATGREQEQAIRIAAVKSLNAILDHSPPRSKLDRDQTRIVKDLYRHVQPSGQLASLLSPPFEAKITDADEVDI